MAGPQSTHSHRDADRASGKTEGTAVGAES